MAVAKITPTGGLAACTYLGGTGNENPQGIDVDSAGNILLLGDTQSGNFPVTPATAHQTNLAGNQDLILARLSSDLTQLLYGTYLGGAGFEYSDSGIVGPDGSIFIVGGCEGDWPTTPGAFQETRPGDWDGVLAKFSPSIADDDRDGDGMADDWEIRHFGGTNVVGGEATADWDRDGLRNLHEYLAGTDPTNKLSALRVSNAVCRVSSEFIIQWQSVSNKSYAIQECANPLTGFAGLVASGITARPPLNTHTVDVRQVDDRFYRIMLE